MDVVQACYFKSSIKNATRDNRGMWQNQGGPLTKVPIKISFRDFLRNSTNKEELNELLRHTIGLAEFQSDKNVY